MPATLTIPILKAEAHRFSVLESAHPEPAMYGVTDGKAVGTYLEHKFQAEFGDFQTPDDLAARATALVAELFGKQGAVRTLWHGFLEAVKTVFIDEVEADRRAAAGPAPEVVIVKAVYGDLPKGASVDVTDKVRSFVSEGKRSIKASNDVFGDPAPGRIKELHVEYTRNRKTATTQAFRGNIVVFR